MPDQEDAEVHARPFSDSLREFNKGRVHDELTTALHQLIDAVQETQKTGKLTLVIQLVPQKNTDMLMVKDKVSVDIPQPDRNNTLFFVDRAGNLTRENPTQLAFDSIRIASIQAESIDNAKEKHA